ncbi:MAG: hypothetical protein HYS19_00415 [Nitrosomonadales bacterium]|nr:hypothetical protein [Nitrosomonadales bacterium]
MKNNWTVALGVIALACMPHVFAAESALPAAPVQQDTHAGHGDHAGAGEMSGMSGAGKSTAWTAFPTLKIRMGGESRDLRVVTVVPQGIVASSINAYSNNPEDVRAHRQLPLEMAGARLDKPESGGYHWLAAREERGEQVRVASTIQFFSDAGAVNPTAMFMQQKHELEIIPQPYPREHSRYRANEDWKFLVRFNSKPLANQKVLMETRNGSKVELVSDAQGVVHVRIPDDFKAEEPKKTAGGHDHERRTSDFVLATEHGEGGKRYLTAFNAGYGTDAFYQRNLTMGLGFTLLGMIGASPLLRQRKNAGARPTATETVGKDA